MILSQIATILLALTVPMLLLILVGQQERILNTLEDLAYGDDDDGGYGGGSSYGSDPDSPPDSPDDLAREVFERIQEIRSARN
jgi:hypothetical protein